MHTEKPIGVVLAETKEEIREFLVTRLQILQAELRDKIDAWKHSVPLLLIAAALVLAGWITLTFAIVALVHTWFLPDAYSWMWAGLIVAGIYLATGVVIGRLGYSKIASIGIAPKRTLEVLKQDQVWIQNEGRAA